MKIAFASDDEQTISPHFGRAEKYIVYSIKQGEIIERKLLAKDGLCNSHRHAGGQHSVTDARGRGFGRQSSARHQRMFENIRDCDVVVTRGMGQGAYLELQQLGVKPVVTDIPDFETAIRAILDKTIINHTEQLH